MSQTRNAGTSTKRGGLRAGLLCATVLLAGASPPSAETRTSPGGSGADLEEEASDDEPDRFEGTVRSGVEYDSNATRRASGEGVAADGLTRYFATLEGRLRGTDDASIRLRLRQGGKLFFRTHEADALLTEAGLGYRYRLAERWSVRFDASVKDRFERRSRQDYNRGRATGGLLLRLGPVGLRGTAGWRYFVFRPNPASSSHGPTASLGGGVRIVSSLRLRGRYAFSRRRFQARRLVRRDDLVQSDADRLRRDGLHVVRLGAAYRGRLIVEGDYVFWSNTSNSYGQDLTRHGLELNATVPLPWRLYLSGQLRLQRTHYGDPLFLGPNFTVDENDRNAMVASIARVIGEHWELEMRYRLFLEEFGAADTYRRQTGFFGVGYVF